VAGLRTTILKLAVLPALGALFFIVPTVYMVRQFRDPDLAVVNAPGRAEFTVTKPDSYTVWRRVTGISSDNEFVTQRPELPAGLRVFLLRKSDQTTVPLQESGGSTMQNGTVYHHSLFRADMTSGSYELVAESSTEPITLVVSRNKASLKGFVLVAVCYLAGALLMIAGVICIVVVLIRRAAAANGVRREQ
jgi:hypothetical protein